MSKWFQITLFILISSFVFSEVHCSLFSREKPAQIRLVIPEGLKELKLDIPVKIHNKINNSTQVENALSNQNTSTIRNKLMNNLQQQITPALEKVRGFFTTNKYKKLTILGVGSGAFGYFYLLYKLKSDALFLSKKSLWSQWEFKKTLSELLAIEENVLIRTLLYDIEEKYTQIDFIEDFSTPLSVFLKDVEKEAKRLERYLWWGKNLERLHLEKLFQVDTKLVLQTQERLDRLAFLKNKIWGWISKRNVESLVGA